MEMSRNLILAEFPIVQLLPKVFCCKTHLTLIKKIQPYIIEKLKTWISRSRKLKIRN
jgi:hypothetical protein